MYVCKKVKYETAGIEQRMEGEVSRDREAR